MRVTVSIPDPIFAKAEKLAERLGISRDAYYTRALERFLKLCEEDEVAPLAGASVE